MITVKEATAAFVAWNTAVREDPSKFLTDSEAKALATADLSESQGIYFVALLRQQAAR
jgi:hypothetical protein